MAKQGWFRYKLNRLLTEEEAAAAKALAGPVYLDRPKLIVAHVNCAWITERWLTQQGIGFYIAERPKPEPTIPAIASLPELREWVPAFLTHYQNDFIQQMGGKDGVLAVMPTGAGKTLAGIVYGLLRDGPIVFITRAAARRTICGEIRKYTTCEPVLLEGKTERDIPKDTRFIVVGWESLNSHYAALLRAHPRTVIFDEIHVASNHKRREAVVVRDEEAMEAARVEGKVQMEYRRLNNRFAAAEDLSRKADFRLGLTATPIRDRVRNLWGQLDLLNPRGWGGFYPWAFRYAGAHESPWGGINTDGRGTDLDMQELIGRLSFSTYYIPQSVTHRDLPPMRRQVTYIPPDELSTGKDVLKELKEHGYQSATGEVWAKLAHAAAMKRDRVVEEAVAGAYRAPDGRGGGKVVVFTGLRADAEKIAQKIEAVAAKGLAKGAPKLTVFMGHGGTPNRDAIREAYMAHPGPCVLVGTGDSWGESLNLQDTDLAIIAMLPWTPGQIRQWEGRFKRQGMTRPVLLMYLVAEGTADEHVAHALLNKLPAVEMVAKDEVLTEFAVDLRGDEEAVAAGFLAKLTADNDEDDDDDEDEEDDGEGGAAGDA